MMIKKPSFRQEHLHWKNGIEFVIGIDEVGRGAFAGPIVAAAVVFSKNIDIKLLKEINDSKLLKPIIRKKLSDEIKKSCLDYSIETIDINYINKYGIGKANTAVFRKVLKDIISKIPNKKYFILIDGFHKKYLPGGIKKQKGIVKGDRISLSIASASIIAKVYRDDLMKKYSKSFPNFQFSRNKGYGTKIHKQAIKTYGLTKIHRTSFNLEKYIYATR